MKRIYRHPLVVRLTHWLVFLALIVLAMSGMQIFDAHPALYASDASKFGHAVLAIDGTTDPNTLQPYGYVQVGNRRLTTTHFLGYTSDGMGGEEPRAFPGWATIPSYRDLADGRRWHFLFAWVFVLCALAYAWFARRLIPSKQDWRALPRAIRTHLLPWRVKAQAEYNPLQKFGYFGVVFVLAPLMIVSGLALSPAIDAWTPWLPAILGGRQFARIWHFAGMIGLIAFFIGHVAMVAITGLWNNLRSMVTGWFAVRA